MTITAKEVKKLRDMTGMGMMDCKNALTEANGDYDKAIEILRKRGEKIFAKRADRETNEGVVLIHSNSDESEAVLIALSCETEPVSQNAEFVGLANAILKVATAQKPSSKEELLQLSHEGTSLQEMLTNLAAKMGEKLEVSAYEYIKAEKVIPYIHAGSKLGVLVAFEGATGDTLNELGKDVAMQIAAMSPVAIDKDDVDSSIIEKELEIGREQALAEGKPANMVDKIAEGKLNKFYKEQTLLNQAFVKDGSKTIKQLLKEFNEDLKISSFKRVSVN